MRTATVFISIWFGATVAWANEPRHHISAIIGGTNLVSESESGFTFGIDYEYALNKDLGIGFVLERAEGEIDATSLFAVIDLHITEQLVLQVGPGVEWAHDETLTVGRIGGYYEFEIGDFTLAPTVSYDISEADDAIVYGLLLGIRF